MKDQYRAWDGRKIQRNNLFEPGRWKGDIQTTEEKDPEKIEGSRI